MPRAAMPRNIASVIATLVAVKEASIAATQIVDTSNADARLTDTILTSLTISEGRESVSYLHREMRENGWKGLGTLADFEKLCRRLGFVVYDGRNDRNQRTRFVALEVPADEA